MLSFDAKNHRRYLIILLIAIFTIFAFWIRMIPLFGLGSTDILNIAGSDDPLYNLRQIEQVLKNFPHYAWFDAMTHFPDGDFIYWGPLFTYICAAACMITGAATRPEIITTSLAIPPIMAAVLVPIMYCVGKSCGDWKTGLFASGFLAVVSGQYYYRSFYGYLDHHIAEVFFATIFCLAYIYTLQTAKAHTIDLKDPRTIQQPALIAALAGIAYLLGLFTMPTMILFAMIVVFFTLVQSVIDFYRDISTEYLVITNGSIFIVAIIGLLLFGIKSPNQISLAVYSYGHVYAYLAVIAGTLLLFGLAKALKNRNKHLYPLLLAAIAGTTSLVLFLASPAIFNLLVSSFFSFFGQAAEVLTVQEARGWSIEFAWTAFSYGLILMALGGIVLAYKNIREEHPHQVFALIWSVIIFAATWQHIRYEYYLAVNIALLSAVAISFTLDMSWPAISRLISGSRKPSPAGNDPESPPDGKRTKKQKKNRARREESRADANLIPLAAFAIVVILSALFVYASVDYSYANAVGNPIRMDQNWRESLEWLGNNTPETGVDYYAIHEKDSFTYPAGAYGVMTWWDYGHMITYISKRIPNANPFQRGVSGNLGAAAYFMTTSEAAANTILDQLGTKYVITDIEMDLPTGKFPAMSTWFNSSVSYQPYQTIFAIEDPAQANMYQQVYLNNQSYYLTMVSRLHNFDGSMTAPGEVYYIEYVSPSVTKMSVPVITNAAIMNATEASAKARAYNAKAPSGYGATVMNIASAIYLPVDTVPALRHYRLIHESPTDVFGGKGPADIRYVKVFEYVRGAHIRGEGIIEVTVVSNTGRTFTYRQQSANGEFIVPYATSGSSFDVKAVGKYRIAGSDRVYDVPEEAVVNGLTIQ